MAEALKCVIGNCMDPYKNVERRYWNIRSAALLPDVEDRAYLDVCYFHSEMFKSRTVHVPIEGWDRLTD